MKMTSKSNQIALHLSEFPTVFSFNDELVPYSFLPLMTNYQVEKRDTLPISMGYFLLKKQPTQFLFSFNIFFNKKESIFHYLMKSCLNV